MAQPTLYDVHVNRPLTNLSIAYMQEEKAFVSSDVFPVVPVEKQSDLYFLYKRGNMIRDAMQIRAAGKESAGTGFELDNTPNYFAKVRALHHDIPDMIRANSDQPLNPDSDATRFLTQLAWISREKVWTAQYFTTSVWGNTDQTGVASAPGANQFLQWNNPASTPIEDIRAQMLVVQIASGGLRPNKIVFSRSVYDRLIDQPDVIDRIKAGQTPGGPAIGNKQALAMILELKEVIVMDAVENTAAEGATDSNALIGGKAALLVYAAPSPGLMVPSAGYTFSWQGWFGAEETGQRIKTFRMEPQAQTRVEIENAYDMKLVGSDMGVYFASAVA
jgi:hypothetical protein